MLAFIQPMQICQNVGKLRNPAELVAEIHRVADDDVRHREAPLDKKWGIRKRRIQGGRAAFEEHFALRNDGGHALLLRQHEIQRVEFRSPDPCLELSQREAHPLLVQRTRPTPRRRDETLLRHEIRNRRANRCRFEQRPAVDDCRGQFAQRLNAAQLVAADDAGVVANRLIVETGLQQRPSTAGRTRGFQFVEFDDRGHSFSPVLSVIFHQSNRTP